MTLQVSQLRAIFLDDYAGCKPATHPHCITWDAPTGVCDIYAPVQAAAPADGKVSDRPAAVESRCDDVPMPLHHRCRAQILRMSRADPPAVGCIRCSGSSKARQPHAPLHVDKHAPLTLRTPCAHTVLVSQGRRRPCGASSDEQQRLWQRRAAQSEGALGRTAVASSAASAAGEKAKNEVFILARLTCFTCLTQAKLLSKLSFPLSLHCFVVPNRPRARRSAPSATRR